MSVASGSPRHWILTSYWSLQKYGHRHRGGWSLTEQRRAPAPWPDRRRCSNAQRALGLPRCRARTPRRRWPRRAARSCGPPRRTPRRCRPRRRCRRAIRRQDGNRCRRSPESASSSVPSPSTTFCDPVRSPLTSVTPTPQRTSTPSARCSRATSSPICSPSTEASGVGCGSTSTTSTPRLRRLAATSQPMNPAPTTTARRAVAGVLAQRQALVERAQHVDAREVREGPECAWAPGRSR